MPLDAIIVKHKEENTMGQRLTIQIFKNELENDSLATVYYHWSAYTESALEELQDFYNAYQEHYDSESPDAMAVATLQAVLDNGGNLSDDDKVFELYPELKEYYDTNRISDRSNGLVAFTKDRQRELLSYSEGDIRLYLEEKEFDFGVYVTYDPEFDMEYFQDFLGDELEGLTEEQILNKCEKELLTIKLDRTHSVDDIQALLETLEQDEYFYDPEQEVVVGKIY